jgi:membrane protease YdiL (CAAX protease family)
MMNRRLLLALGAFVIWTAITVIGGRLRAGGEAELVEGMIQGVNWVFPVAAAFLLAVVAWQRWDDVGLKTAPVAGSLRLLWLPALYIAAFLVLGAIQGLPPLAVITFVLINTFFVGLSEELMFRGVLLQALRHSMAIWPAILVTSLLFGGIHSLNVFHHRSLADLP